MEARASGSKDLISYSPDARFKEASNINKKKELNILKCNCCKLEEQYDYKGSKPPFAKHLSFLEDCYIMKDPFDTPNKGEILVLGSDCSVCGDAVCVDCSLFYTKRFCKKCAYKNIKHFPERLQSKIIVLSTESDKDF